MIDKIKEKLNKYLNNQITLEELNSFFENDVPFTAGAIEALRLNADLAVEGELTKEDKEDGLLSEKEFKEIIKEQIEKL